MSASLEDIGKSPGGDAAVSYLRVIHNDDGTLKSGISVPGTVSAFNVIDYGADPTGATDSTATFAAAASAAHAGAFGGNVYVPPGTYTLTALVTYANLRWVGAGGATISFTGSAGAGKAITVSGSQISAGLALAADAAEDTKTVTLATGGGASFAAGAYVYLQNTAVTLCQMNRVASVAGDVLTLTDPLYETFTVAGGAQAFPVTLVSGVGFEGFTFDFSNFVGANNFGCYLDLCLNPELHRCRFRNAVNGSALYALRSYGAQFSKLIFDNCGNAAIAALTLARSSGFQLDNILVTRGGFGAEMQQANGGQVSNLRSLFTSGRAFKLNGAAHILGSNIEASNSVTETGFSITLSSHHNSFHGVTALNNATSEGIWFSGQTNHHNVVMGVVSRGNSLFDVAFNATDTFNYVEGDFSAAKVRNLGDATNRCRSLTELPTADPHVLGMLWVNAGVLTVSAG